MGKILVLDTNILLRAVFGVKVPAILAKYGKEVDFFTPAFCYEELRKYAYTIGEKKGLSVEYIGEITNRLEKIVRPISEDVYKQNEEDAKNRISVRDLNDWPLVALALTLNCGIWTEDHDFFGTGLSTWNSRNVEIFLNQQLFI